MTLKCEICDERLNLFMSKYDCKCFISLQPARWSRKVFVFYLWTLVPPYGECPVMQYFKKTNVLKRQLSVSALYRIKLCSSCNHKTQWLADGLLYCLFPRSVRQKGIYWAAESQTRWRHRPQVWHLETGRPLVSRASCRHQFYQHFCCSCEEEGGGGTSGLFG